MFNRYNNRYCKSFIAEDKKRSFRESIRSFYSNGGHVAGGFCPDKYRAVTLRSFDNGRIEIRAPGNKDYQLRSDDIHNVLGMVKKCAVEAYNFTVKKRKYSLCLHTALYNGIDISEDRVCDLNENF